MTRPEARESTAKRRQSFRRIEREDGEMEGHIDFALVFVEGSDDAREGFEVRKGGSRSSPSESESSPSASSTISSSVAS